MSDFDSVNRGFERAFARRAKQQALLNNPELQHQHDEQEKQKEVQAVERQAQSQAQALEREIARQLDNANASARAEAKIEAARAEHQANVLVRKQAKEHVQAMLNNPDLKRQAQLQANQVKLQSEHLLTQVGDSIAKSKAQLASLKADNVLPDTPVMESLPTPPKLSDEEQYQTTIVTKMVALIKQRKMK